MDTPVLMTILIVVLIISFVGGGVGHRRFGVVGWSSAGILLLVVVVLWLIGNLC